MEPRLSTVSMLDAPMERSVREQLCLQDQYSEQTRTQLEKL